MTRCIYFKINTPLNEHWQRRFRHLFLIWYMDSACPYRRLEACRVEMSTGYGAFSRSMKLSAVGLHDPSLDLRALR